MLNRNILIILSSLNFACNQGFESINLNNINEDKTEEELPVVDDGDIKDELIEDALVFCSKLDFSNMTKPDNMNPTALNAFALALNISSTFEGHQMWRNITNNFDGMGLSLGLLNQTLGTGSLQPLLLQMLEDHEIEMSSFFSVENFESIKEMTLRWRDQVGIQQRRMPIFIDDSPHHLDIHKRFYTFANPNRESVTWAVNTIYRDAAGRNFKPEWRYSLQNMANSKHYRQIQFYAARYLHDRASTYFLNLGFKEIRSYLFFFDIVVQNGGLYSQNINEYNDFINQNPNADEKERLYFILNSRLQQVRPQFREDVRARKSSLIEGRGRVHQTNRDYEIEFCYSSNTSI